MAFLNHNDPEDLVVCPFDDTHMISHKRYQIHIKDCRRNNFHVKLKQCPFNARHQIKEELYQHHLANCPDKAYIEQEQQYYRRNGEVRLGGCLKVPDYDNSSVIPSTEDWDAEATAPPFMLGQPQHENFTPYAAPHLSVTQATIPGLPQTQYVRKKPRDLNQPNSQPSYSPVERMEVSSPQKPQLRVPRQQSLDPTQLRVPKQQSLDPTQLRVPKQQSLDPTQLRVPKQQSLEAMQRQQTAAGGMPLSRPAGLGRGLGRGSLAMPQQHTWTAAGRGRARDSVMSGEPRLPKTAMQGAGDTAMDGTLSTGVTMTTVGGASVIDRPSSLGYSIAGRGRGRGVMSFNASSLMSGRCSPTVSYSTDSPLSSSDNNDQFEDAVEREKLREERKIRKRLKQIEILLQREAAGQPLTQQEKAKVDKKPALLKQLQDLKLVTD